MEAAPHPEPGGDLRKEIGAALRADDLKSARRLLESSPGDWRTSGEAQQLEARLLLGEGAIAPAEGLCRQMLAADPADAEAANVLVEVLRRSARLDEARGLFVSAVWQSPVALDRKFKQLAALASGGERADAADFLERIDAAPVAGAAQQLAGLEAMVGLPARALARLSTVPAGELTAASKGLLARLLTQLGRRQEALVRLQEFLQADPEAPALAAQLCQLQVEMDEPEAAADTLDHAIRRWPDDWQIVKQLYLQPLPKDRFSRLLDHAALARQSRSPSDLASWHFAQAALRAGRTETACEVLSDLAPKRWGHHAAELLDALCSRPLPSWTERPRFENDGTRLFDCVRTDGALATLVVFPGLHNDCHHLPFSYVDALLKLHAVNVIYVQDPRQFVLVDGMTSFGGGRPYVLAGLRDLVAELGAPRLVTAGFSGGAFTAMRCAALLDADAVLSFSGPTVLASLEDDASAPARLAFLHAFSHFSARERDVRPDIEAKPNLRVWQFPGSEHIGDMRQAARLAHLPHVVTEPCEGVSSHATLLPIITAGRFDGIISRACGGAAA